MRAWPLLSLTSQKASSVTASPSIVPVPKTLLQELVSYYSRSETKPHGVKLDDPFELPARIKQIEVGQAQAVVVQ